MKVGEPKNCIDAKMIKMHILRCLLIQQIVSHFKKNQHHTKIYKITQNFQNLSELKSQWTII